MYNSRGEMIYKEATAKSDLSSKVEQWNPGPITLTKDTYYVCISVDKSAYYPATFMFNLKVTTGFMLMELLVRQVRSSLRI